ncbi:MAG: hypothetical protein H0V51_24480, partial [Chloroflexi bacterium]|nr:hypothetical protein [Chloroflexota bacterium]
SLGRFFIQFFRLDTPFLWGLSQAQLLSFAIGAVAVWILVYQTASSRREPPAYHEDDAEPVEAPPILAGADEGRRTNVP